MANNLFHHEEIYRGSLKNFAKRILVCGCGAIGSNLLDTLSRQGFSNLSVIDFDRVEKHNISTQIWKIDEIGKLKVHALQDRLYETTNVINVNIQHKKLESKNANKLLKDFDLIVDGFDNTEARQIVTDFCKKNSIPCVHAGLFEDYGEVIWNKDYVVPEKTEGIDVCDYPLARNIIMLTVAVLAEQVIRFCMAQKTENFAITLKDNQIRRL